MDGGDKLFDYFIVAGLRTDQDATELAPELEFGCKVAEPLAPITDICVIFPSVGETVPEGFECIERTAGGQPADLNHGSLPRTPTCHLCFRRGYHKPPLVDIGVLYQDKGERPMVDSQVVGSTPYGRPANVNNAAHGVYLTYRRAADDGAPNQLAVTEICVILRNKGEQPPHTFCMVRKDLNRGMVGSNVFVCYKKSHAAVNRIAYKPDVIDRFPLEDDPCFPLPHKVAMFCLPMGAVIECWPSKHQPPGRQFSTFVLTDAMGRRCYGAAVVFYEKYDGMLTTEQLKKLGLDPESQNQCGSWVSGDSSSTNDPADAMAFHSNRAICILSRHPLFQPFKRLLFHLHRMAAHSRSVAHTLPVERYISYTMYEVPLPHRRRPRVMVQLDNAEAIYFDSLGDLPLPVNGANFMDFLRNLGSENCVYAVLLALLEQRVLVHSLRPWLLCSVCESIRALMFPFAWQCPYIPQCPLDLAGVLHAPLPFIVGVDSQYFELYEDPPSDVTSIDLDTSTVSQSDVRKQLKLSCLPKKPLKLLLNTLDTLNGKAQQHYFAISQQRRRAEWLPTDLDYENHRRQRRLELAIREAFLRFMASIMKGYSKYLKPIRSAPRAGTTDTGELFNVDEFLRTRDRNSTEFWRKFANTQCFIRFIEERSLLSDQNAYYAYFDECVSKVDPAGESSEPRLLGDSVTAANCDHTVFVPPPEPLPHWDTFSYNGWPEKLDVELFAMSHLCTSTEDGVLHSLPSVPNMYSTNALAARRTQQETKLTQNLARVQWKIPFEWAKCLLGAAYSVWFMLLPSLAAAHARLNAHSDENAAAARAIKLALLVLARAEKPPPKLTAHEGELALGQTADATGQDEFLESGGQFDRREGSAGERPLLDQLCYRVVMQLAGAYGHPRLAVQTHLVMAARGVRANAITDGIYHGAVLSDGPEHALDMPWLGTNQWPRAHQRWRTAVAALRAARRWNQCGQIGKQKRVDREKQHAAALSHAPHLVEHDAGYASLSTLATLQSASSEQALTNEAEPVISGESGLHADMSASEALDDSVFDRTAGQSGQSGDRTSPRPTSDNRTPSPFKAVPVEHDPLGALSEAADGNGRGGDNLQLQPDGEQRKRVAQLEQLRPFENDAYLEAEALVAAKESSQSRPSIGSVASDWLNRMGVAKPLGKSQSVADALFSPGIVSHFSPEHAAGSEWASTSMSATDHSQQRRTSVFASGGAAAVSPSLTQLVGHANKLKARMSDAVAKGQHQGSVSISRLARSSAFASASAAGAALWRSGFRAGGTQRSSQTSSLRGSTQDLIYGDATSMDTASVVGMSHDGVFAEFGDAEFQASNHLPASHWTFLLGDSATAPLRVAAAFEPNTIWPLCDAADTGAASTSGRVDESVHDATATDANVDWPRGDCDELREVVVVSASKCSHCECVVYDEDCMLGWSWDEAAFHTKCPYCEQRFVPKLTVTCRRLLRASDATFDHGGKPQSDSGADAIKDSWYVRPPAARHAPATEIGAKSTINARRKLFHREDVENVEEEPVNSDTDDGTLNVQSADATPRPDDWDQVATNEPSRTTTSNWRCASSTCQSEPFLSPLVVRRQLENVLATDPSALLRPDFAQTNAVLFWNLLYYSRRLALPTHLAHWLAADGHSANALFAIEADSHVPLRNRRVCVRCAYDSAPLHGDECAPPLWAAGDESVASLWPDKARYGPPVLAQITHALAVGNVHKIVQILINEHRKRMPSSGQAAACTDTPGTPQHGGQAQQHLARHCSLYRDVSLAALRWHKGAIDADSMHAALADTLAGGRLAPKVQSMLAAADRPPPDVANVLMKMWYPMDAC